MLTHLHHKFDSDEVGQNDIKRDDERTALDDLDARIDRLREEEEQEKLDKKEAKRQKREEAEKQAKAGLADGFEEMMGFGGFGNKKK
jgi:hypothetical protein